MQSYITVNLNSGSGRSDSAKRRAILKQQQQRSKSDIRRDAIRSCLQKSIAFFFTQVGVLGLLVGYTILGAIIFIEVESATESRRLDEVTQIRAQVARQLYNVTRNHWIEPRKWEVEVEQIVKNFQVSLIREIRLGYDGSSDPIWTFPASLMFCLSVYTTIGYGNLVPKTEAGKVLTMFYSILGIPLLLLYMRIVGDLLATSARKFYSSVNRCKASLEKIRRSRVLTLEEHRALDRRSIQIQVRRGGIQVDPGCCDEEEEDMKLEKSDGPALAPLPLPRSLLEKGEKEPPEDTDWTNEVTIPISTVFALFFLYIIMGSIVFCWFEQWSFLDGIFFCFISLVTIGFGGDLVPANSPETRKNHVGVDNELIFCSIYILLGMAIMAMNFHLTQEKFFEMAKRLGEKLHLLS